MLTFVVPLFIGKLLLRTVGSLYNMTLKILTQFSYTPGPRYVVEGPFSGELFRNTILRPEIEKAIREGHILIVDLDGTAGYGRSFLEESFGGLIRQDHLDHDKIVKHLKIVSTEQPELIDKISFYLQNAHAKEKLD